MAIISRALLFAQRWFDAATVQRVFEPLIADRQREWQDASPSRRARGQPDLAPEHGTGRNERAGARCSAGRLMPRQKGPQNINL
jgi:hypothetical protein